MFALVKPFLVAVAIIFFLLYAIGVVRFEKAEYACFTGKDLRFADKVELINVGSVRVFAYPLVSDCPEDERYDPARIYECAYQTFCQREVDETAAE